MQDNVFIICGLFRWYSNADLNMYNVTALPNTQHLKVSPRAILSPFVRHARSQCGLYNLGGKAIPCGSTVRHISTTSQILSGSSATGKLGSLHNRFKGPHKDMKSQGKKIIANDNFTWNENVCMYISCMKNPVWSMVQIWHGKSWFKNLVFSLWGPLRSHSTIPIGYRSSVMKQIIGLSRIIA